MGRSRVRFNVKGRIRKDIEILEPKEKVEVNSKELEKQCVDSCNALVLPVKKRKTKDVSKKVKCVRILSKKQKKRLQYIVQRKEKKDKRAGILESLKQVQGDPEILLKLQSVSGTQTKGLKRIQVSERLRSVGGNKKIRAKSKAECTEAEEPDYAQSVVGTDVRFSSDSSESGEEEETNREDLNEPGISHPLSVSGSGTGVPARGNQPGEIAIPESAVELSSVGENSPTDPGKLLGLQYTPVARSPEIQQARLQLPILSEEQRIVEAVRENRVVVLAGETGSGKTTQVPQFLYEAGYARDKMIGVTEPRRVAAISMSRRVAEEMNVGPDVISYQIRFQSNVTPRTRIKFMTDGVLLKEVESDFLLSSYSVIILDEAHERSVFTDILVGLLSRIVLVREKRQSPLKLIIMSATLRVQDFTENARLFRTPPPVVSVESRQFPVTVHWNKHTADNYVAEALRKTCKIHSSLPAGGILVFLTGRKEVNHLVRRLQQRFPLKKGQTAVVRGSVKPRGSARVDDEDGDVWFRQKKSRNQSACLELPSVSLDHYPVLPPCEQSEDLLEGSGLSDSDCEEEKDVGGVASVQSLDVRPLYAMLASEEQERVFLPPAAGARLCVVATNVAETSLTIPGIRYVVDCGRVKRKLYEASTGVSAFRVTWQSQAGACQRAGRAGRTGPGHCYRLFSSAVFQHEMQQFALPEIQCRPLADVLLQMRSLGIDRVFNFPFPSPPDQKQLQSAEQQLLLLGALEAGVRKSESRVTTLGRAMANFPVAPRFAKMLALSRQSDLLPLSICLVASLSVPELLSGGSPPPWSSTVGEARLLGDAMLLLRAVGAAEFAADSAEFCRKHGLRIAAVREVSRLRVQLSGAVGSVLHTSPGNPSPPSAGQCRLLRQLLLAALPDHVAERVDAADLPCEQLRQRWNNAYRCTLTDQPVFLHASCVLRRVRPRFVVFQELQDTGRLFMRTVSAIEPEWLPRLCPGQCACSPPLPHPPPSYHAPTGLVMCHVTVKFGPAQWPLPAPVCVQFPKGEERYRQLAVFLLSGQVAPALAPFTEALLAPPVVMTRSWARLQPRTEAVLGALRGAGVDTGSALQAQWKQDPHFLLSAYLQWLPHVLHEKIERLWPPVLCQESAE